MSTYNLPTTTGLLEMTEMFIPQGVNVAAHEPQTTSEFRFVAVFKDPEGAVAAACLCDLPLAAGLGAALSMIPPGAAEDMVAENALTDTAKANLYEVMNMFSSLLMDDNTAHLKLTDVGVLEGDGQLPAGAQAAAFAVQAGAYGGGNLQFYAT